MQSRPAPADGDRASSRGQSLGPDEGRRAEHVWSSERASVKTLRTLGAGFLPASAPRASRG